jgi:hypothetical protein
MGALSVHGMDIICDEHLHRQVAFYHVEQKRMVCEMCDLSSDEM